MTVREAHLTLALAEAAQIIDERMSLDGTDTRRDTQHARLLLKIRDVLNGEPWEAR